MEVRASSKSRCRNPMDHCSVTQNRKIERRPIESDELRRKRRDLVHEGCDQLLLGSLSCVRCPKRIHSPTTAFFTMGNQRPDTDDRVVDVLGELVAQFGSDLVVGLADVAIRGGKAFQVGDSFDVPNDNVAHGAHSTGWPLESLSIPHPDSEPLPRLIRFLGEPYPAGS